MNNDQRATSNVGWDERKRIPASQPNFTGTDWLDFRALQAGIALRFIASLRVVGGFVVRLGNNKSNPRGAVVELGFTFVHPSLVCPAWA
jgi:hypothetical protein